MPDHRYVTPKSFEAAAAALAAAASRGQGVRIAGSGTKLGWGAPRAEPDLELLTAGLDRVAEHNEGDLTAVLEAGVPLARAQEAFAAAGQMLALDPDLGAERGATIGGVLATGDCGPLRHRYGAPRDLVLGMTVALSDGTIARSGGKVIKNVAGYDIAKLYCGSFGTLGLILSASFRLHPLPVATATAAGACTSPDGLVRAARMLAAAPLELEALDFTWRSGTATLLARCGGAEASRRARRAAELMAVSGLDRTSVEEEDDELWARQRSAQRSPTGVLVRVATRPSALAEILRRVEACDGAAVGRAALCHAFVELDPDRLDAFLGGLPGSARWVLLDAPAAVRETVDPWGGAASEGPAVELMRRVKVRFDPARTCNPGVFVGGI